MRVLVLGVICAVGLPAEGADRTNDVRRSRLTNLHAAFSDRESGPAPMGVRGLRAAEPERPGSYYEIESKSVSFGEVLPGNPSELSEALVVRVFSPTAWKLRLALDGGLECADRMELVPASRLRWRGPLSRRFEQLQGTAPVVVAEGAPTSGAGRAVVIDLRLDLEDEDPIGRYRSRLRLSLE